MLLVKTKLAPSSISGKGVFADQFIPKDTLIWRFSPQFDLCISLDQLSRLPFGKQAFVKKYAYLSNGEYILSRDNDRFTNHSTTPNTIACDEGTKALRDIQSGEELTCDYFTFDGDANCKLSS